MMTVLVPLSSEAHERDTENPRLLRHSLAATALCTFILAGVAALFSSRLLSLNATWREYQAFAPLLAPLTLIAGASIIIATVVAYEMACRRFAAAAFVVAANLALAGFLVAFTGHEFFRGLLPDAAVDWMASLRVARLSAILGATGAATFTQILLLVLFCKPLRKPFSR